MKKKYIIKSESTKEKEGDAMRKEKGGEREKKAIKVTPSFLKKHIGKRKIQFVCVIVCASVMNIFVWKVLKKEASIDVILMILGTVFYLCYSLFVRLTTVKKILEEDQSIRMKVCQIGTIGIAWLLFCVLCGTAVVAAGAVTKKIVFIESGKEPQENTYKEISKIEEVRVSRNSKEFDWGTDIYIDKLSDYYDGETEKLSNDQKIFYRYQLLLEYLDLQKIPISKGENSIENYENYTSKANDYYELYDMAKMKYSEDIQLQLLDSSKEARENADQWYKTSINQYLIGVIIMDIENIKANQQNKNSYDIEAYENALMWYILAYRQATAEMENDYEVGVENMKKSFAAINNTYLDLTKSEDADTAQKANNMLQVLKYELKVEKIELLGGVK